jgi:hypothetical protein
VFGGRIVAGLADGLGGTGTFHFRCLAHPGLAEHRQKHDAAARCDPVGDALGVAAEVEAQLAELAAEMTGVGLAERGGVRGEPVDLLLIRRESQDF